MVYLANNPYRTSDIYHHGIKGQRWGVRRFQNPDGTLTEEGKRRYYNSDGSLNSLGKKTVEKFHRDAGDAYFRNDFRLRNEDYPGLKKEHKQKLSQIEDSIYKSNGVDDAWNRYTEAVNKKQNTGDDRGHIDKERKDLLNAGKRTREQTYLSANLYIRQLPKEIQDSGKAFVYAWFDDRS